MKQSTKRLLRGAGIPPTGFTQSTAYVAGGGEGPVGLRLLLLILTSLAISTGCEDVNHYYMPLCVGNAWTYRVVSGDTTLGVESLSVVEKLSTTLLTDDTYRRYRMKEPDTTAIWSEDERTVMRSAGRSFITVVQHPPFTQTGWTDRSVGGGDVYCRVLRRERVEIPAGEFAECIVIQREAADLSSRVTQWFAPDVGLVKWRVERPRERAIEWRLISYSIEGGTSRDE